MTRPRKALAIRRLQRSLDAIPNLQKLRHGSPKFEKWRRDARVTITNTFNESSTQEKEFNDIAYSPFVYYSGMSDSEYQKSYFSGLESAAVMLESMIDEVDEFWEDESQHEKSFGTSKNSHRSNTNQVFVIHGRDLGARDTVARLLEDLDLEVIIMQEQPDEGRTVIEKFEQYAKADFAVALFTPDDLGSPIDGELQPRARQNVIFEFGYFIGRFGRDRVRALVKGNPEIPSDYSGVMYIKLDESGAWRMTLIRELKSAGFDIDANRAFE